DRARGKLVGHPRAQQVSPAKLNPALDHLAMERDLDVDLIVGPIDAGAVVDEIGVDPPAILAELDPPCLGDGEVRALADRLDAQLRSIDPDRVVAGIADVGLALAFRLDVGADAAAPAQLGLAFPDRT